MKRITTLFARFMQAAWICVQFLLQLSMLTVEALISANLPRYTIKNTYPIDEVR